MKKYRAERGHLYLFSDERNAYIHVFYHCGLSKSQLIEEYEQSEIGF